MNKNSKLIVKSLKTMATTFTLGRFLGTMFTIIIVALIKYSISGNLSIEYSDFFGNVSIGLLGWTINTGLIAILTEFLEIKGINLNLNQILFGWYTIKIDGGSSSETTKPRYKLYNAMESNDESKGNTPLDKGKGVDKEVHPYYTGGRDPYKVFIDSGAQPLDKGKQVAPPIEAPFATWSRIFPGVDPASVFFPKKINPAPGFNVPGGEVPIRDDICQHIDYNSHILNQFKKMDLETAIWQRDNYLAKIQVLDHKLVYAKEAFSRLPDIPTSENQFKLKNQILKDLETMSKDKTRSEARTILLNSRIQFIEIQMNNNNQNN
jgi:hypothetical protein